MKRKCGTCNECCIQPSIPALHKNAGRRCTNLCDSRCSIYEDRPAPCVEFSCLWREGLLPKSQKPSKTGVLAWVAPRGIQAIVRNKIPTTTWDSLMQHSWNGLVTVGTQSYRNGHKIVVMVAA